MDDHAAEARRCIDRAQGVNPTDELAHIGYALTHAVLALAQEQKAANLLAYEALKYGDTSNPRVDKAVRAYIDHATQEQQP